MRTRLVFGLIVASVCGFLPVQASTVGFLLRYDASFGSFLIQNTSAPGSVDIVGLELDLAAASTTAAASSNGRASSDLRFHTADFPPGAPFRPFETITVANIPNIVYPDPIATNASQFASISYAPAGFGPIESYRFGVDIDSYEDGAPLNNIVGLDNALIRVLFGNGQVLSDFTVQEMPSSDRFYLASSSAALTVIPVPAALWLFASALLGFAAFTRAGSGRGFGARR